MQAAPQDEVQQAETKLVQSLQNQLAEIKLELNEARKFAAIGELASTTTHEFNNVLMTILNYAKMGLRHNDEPTRTKALEKILGAGQRAEKITNSVLGMARNRGNAAAPTDLSAIVAESLVLLEREMSKYRVQVETSFEATRRAQVVATQIQQILLNLLTNARQAMPQGGRVLVKVADAVDGKGVELTVRDTGGGIPAEVLPKIFERNFSTKTGPDAEGKGGAGVGLSACREIIEAHGGRVRVESTVGQGTAFVIRLPAAVEAEANAPIVKLGVAAAG